MARKSYQKGCVQKHNGIWTVRYYEKQHDGTEKRKRDPIDVNSDAKKKEAMRAAEPIMARVNDRNNQVVGHSRYGTFEEFISGPWKIHVEKKQAERKLKDSTVYVNNSIIKKYFLPAFGKRVMNSLTPTDMTIFFDRLKQGKPEQKYLHNVYSLLNSILKVAADYDWLQINPLRESLHRPNYMAKEKPTLSTEQVREIINEVPAEYRLLFLIVFCTGVRIGEAIGFRWLDFDEEERLLSVRNAVWRGALDTPKSQASVRSLRLVPALVAMLIHHRGQSAFQSDSDYIFARSDGRAFDPDHLREVVLYPAMDKLNIQRLPRQHGFHIFRHTAGSLLHQHTGNTKLVQKALGHAHESTTSDIYVHLQPEIIADSVEVLASEILSGLDDGLIN